MNHLSSLILCALALVGCGAPFEAASEQIGMDAESGAGSVSAMGGGAGVGAANSDRGGASGGAVFTEGGASGARAEAGAAGEFAGAGAGSIAGSAGTGGTGGAAPIDPNLWLGAPCHAPPWKAGVPYINPDIVTARCIADISTCIPGELVAFICVDDACAEHQPDGSKGTHWNIRQRCG